MEQQHVHFVSLAVAAALLGTSCRHDEGRTRGEAETVRNQEQATSRPAANAPNYDFSRPAATIDLLADLHEISALTLVDEHTVACMQDEVGTVFIIDLRKGQVTQRMTFDKKGDYEGLARVGTTFWALQSKGHLTELLRQGDNLRVGRKVKLKLRHEDFEGLCYDPERAILLVAPKDLRQGSIKKQQRRRLYGVDPKTGKRLGKPIWKSTVRRMVADAERVGIPLPHKKSRKGRATLDLKVRFSSVAVHPKTKAIYALSAADAGVLVLSRDNRLLKAYFFSDERMRRIEAMTFLPNGDLLIAHEGGAQGARLLRYAWRGTGE